jgi:homoserine kinase
MSDEKLLQIATEMEGHPDNVAAALYGNAVVAWKEEQHGKEVAQAISLSVDTRIRAVAFIPATAVATSKARKMLPETIPHRDAAQNSANSALLVHALTLRPDLLYRATEDFLHQSYRAEAMPASFALLTKLRAAGVAAFISGAGPTVLALHAGTEADVSELIRAAGSKFEAKSLEISRTGAQLL